MMYYVIALLPRKFGAVDVMLPLLYELKMRVPGLRADLIFRSGLAASQLTSNQVMNHVADISIDERVILNECLDRKPKKGFTWSGLRSLLRVVWRIWRSDRAIVFLYGRSTVGRVQRILRRLVRWRGGKVFCFMEAMHWLIDTVQQEGNKPVKNPDTMLYFGPDDVRYMHEIHDGPLIEIGYPRFYQSWNKVLEDIAEESVLSELVRLGEPADRDLVCLSLPSTVEGVFGLDEFETWLDECVRVVREALPSSVILMKPHPAQHLEHLNSFIRMRGWKHVVLTDLHVGALTKASRLVISGFSTTILDVLAAGGAVIQHQKFTDHWLKRWPEGSVFNKLGILSAQTELELRKVVEEAMCPEYEIPDVRALTSHSDNAGNILV